MITKEEIVVDIETLSTEEFAEKYKDIDVLAILDEETLEEDEAPVKRGRGRPKGTTGIPKRRAGDSEAEKAEPRGITQQLGHAADNPEGAKVRFASGEVHHVRRAEAHKALLHFDNEHNQKPEAKRRYLAKLGKSKAHFYDAMKTGKGDEPAGPKKISLARGATYDPATRQYSKEEVEIFGEAVDMHGWNKISSHKDHTGEMFHLHNKPGTDEHVLVHAGTGDIHHGFHGKTKDVHHFLKNYSFSDLPRPTKEEAELSPKQKKIAAMSPPADKIDAGDLAKLRQGKKMHEKYEDSEEDDKEDKKMEKKTGMSHDEWEASDEDKEMDKKAEKKDNDKKSDKKDAKEDVNPRVPGFTHGLASTIHEIMSKNIDLRRMASEEEFKNRNK